MFSKFFINRPIFATVLALLIVVAGLVTLGILTLRRLPFRLAPSIRVPTRKQWPKPWVYPSSSK